MCKVRRTVISTAPSVHHVEASGTGLARRPTPSAARLTRPQSLLYEPQLEAEALSAAYGVPTYYEFHLAGETRQVA